MNKWDNETIRLWTRRYEDILKELETFGEYKPKASEKIYNRKVRYYLELLLENQKRMNY